MGIYSYSKEEKPLLPTKNINNYNNDNEFIITNNEKNNLISNFNDNIIENKKKNNFSSNDNIKKDALEFLTQQIRDINSNINSLNEKIKNIDVINSKQKNNKNNNIYSESPIYHDFFLDEMRNEYIKKKIKIFKSEFKNEIKNKFITPILDSLKKKDEDISYLKFENNNLKSEIKNLNNQILTLKKEISSETNNLIKQIGINNSKIENLQKQIPNEINTLKNQINTEMDNKEKNINNKLEKLSEKNNLEIENLKKKQVSEIELLKKEIEKINLIQVNLKKQDDMINNELRNINEKINKNKQQIEKVKQQDEMINNELKNINEKINKNKQQIEKVKEQVEIINKNSRSNTITIIKESFRKFNDGFKRNYLMNKQKRQHEVKLKIFAEKKYGRVGIDNIGNNCYINSVLQILKNIPKFTYEFYKLNNTSENILNSLKDLLINICNVNISSFSPTHFKKYLGIENKRFAGNNQYDSTIFYVALLNIINKKLNKAKNDSSKKIDMTKYNDKSLQEKFEIWKNNYLSKNQTFIFEFFYIFYVNEIECDSCHNITQTFQSMNFLDFPIITEKGNIKNLEECFENYQMIKCLNDYCSKCHHLKLSQHFTLIELPPVLMINLKRVGEKCAYFNEIEIPFQLDMEKIIKYVKNNSIYELRGFIKHYGKENSGHNLAFCKNMFDDKWYQYNDSICSSIDGEPKLDKIFFLCYIKVGSDVENIEYLKQIIDSLNENK